MVLHLPQKGAKYHTHASFCGFVILLKGGLMLPSLRQMVHNGVLLHNPTLVEIQL